MRPVHVGVLTCIALIVILTCIALIVIGIRDPALLALIAGIAEIVPYVGPFIGTVPAASRAEAWSGKPRCGRWAPISSCT